MDLGSVHRLPAYFASFSHSSEDTQPESQTNQRFGPEQRDNDNDEDKKKSM